MKPTFLSSYKNSAKRIRISAVSTQRNRNELDNSGYLELCTVLRKIITLKLDKCLNLNEVLNKKGELLIRAEELLNNGVKVNNNDLQDNSDTPLHYAIEINNTEIVKMLLLKGAAVNVTNQNLETPLHLAVRKQATHIVHFLLKQGADPQMINHDGHSSFDLLLKYCDASMLKVFSENEVVFDYIVPENLKKKFLELAIACNSSKIIHFFFDFNNVTEQDKNNSTILHQAVSNGNIKIIKLLVEEGFNVNAISKTQTTPLHVAVQKRFENIVRLLLNYNADVNRKDNTGKSVLHYAVIYESTAHEINSLLKNGADLKSKDNYGLMPLNYAVLREYLELVRTLLDKHPDPNDMDNKLAFCFSFIKDDKGSLSKLFVERGFTLDIQDFNDVYIPKGLYHFVENSFNCREVRTSIQELLNKKAVIDPEEIDRYFLLYKVLKGSAEKGFINIFHNLLTPNVNIDASLYGEGTLLHVASNYGHSSIVEVLLNCGADVNARDKQNQTPLLLAVKKKCLKSIQLLLEAGANCNSYTLSNKTPLIIALDLQKSDIVEMLLQYGALIEGKDLLLYRYLVTYSLEVLTLLFDYSAFNSKLNLSNFLDVCFPVLSNRDRTVFKEFRVKCAVLKGSNLNLSQDSRIYDYQIKCQEEIKRMKFMKFEESNVSIFDVLTKPGRQIAIYMRNKNIVRILEAMNVKKAFPIFGSKLDVHLKKGKMALYLQELGYYYLENILKLKMPSVILYKILSYLEETELRGLIIASSIDSEKKSSICYRD